MAKKIPINLNEGDEAEALTLASYLSIKDTYGWFPKTSRFSITFSLSMLRNIAKFIPDLEPDELDMFLSSVKKIKIADKNRELAEKHRKEAERYNLAAQESITKSILRSKIDADLPENPTQTKKEEPSE